MEPLRQWGSTEDSKDEYNQQSDKSVNPFWWILFWLLMYGRHMTWPILFPNKIQDSDMLMRLAKTARWTAHSAKDEQKWSIANTAIVIYHLVHHLPNGYHAHTYHDNTTWFSIYPSGSLSPVVHLVMISMQQNHLIARQLLVHMPYRSQWIWMCPVHWCAPVGLLAFHNLGWF